MRLASLAMYASPPPLAEATAALWSFLSDALKRAGLDDIPGGLDTALRYNEAWTHTDLLLAQTCGFPYVKQLRGKVLLVATPVYDHPGCDGPSKCSFIIVGKGSDARSLEDLRGARAAINEPDSNSGVNLFRAALAPLARNGRFFSSVIETGGHRNSIAAITAGKADVAAIDCVTYGNVLRFDPESLAGVRILAETVKGPGLPIITRAGTSDEEMSLLRQSLRQAMVEPSLATARDVLALKDFAVLSDADYEPLAELERQAQRLGYPVIA
ncbi:MAG: PhnD/SsuA/transferrin family substrate-binding protein [Pararhizobium sp.]